MESYHLANHIRMRCMACGRVWWPSKPDSLPPLITTTPTEMDSMLSDLSEYPMRYQHVIQETYALGLPD